MSVVQIHLSDRCALAAVVIMTSGAVEMTFIKVKHFLHLEVVGWVGV